MKIEIVHLRNIRSHIESTIPFARGFNCLVGSLGSGKSSILYSIDFALFGEPIGRSFDYLLRDDADEARVTVHFAHNGKDYRICRGLKRRGKGISQNFDELKFFEGEELISSTKSDAVAEQLKTITGLDKELFREIVWIRQEHLKEFLDVAPRERQKRLDELFGLSGYETAWVNLAGYQKEYEGERKAYERDPDVIGLEKTGAEYNEVAEQFALIEIEIQKARSELKEAERTLHAAEAKLRQLEEVRAANEKLRQMETELKTQITGIDDTLVSLSEEAGKKSRIIEDFKKRLLSFHAQAESYRGSIRETGVSADQSTEAFKQSIAALDEKIAALKGEHQATVEAIDKDEKRLVSLGKEDSCPLCMQQLGEEYKTGLVDRIRVENDGRRLKIHGMSIELLELQQRRSKMNSALNNLQALLPRIDDLTARIREENEEMVKLAGNIEQKRVQQQEMADQLSIVQMELMKFDTSKLEEARSNKERALALFYKVDSDLRTKENRKKDLTSSLDAIKERIDMSQQKIERMQNIARALEVIEAMRDAYRGIQPKLRSEFVVVLRNFVQQVLDRVTGDEGSPLNVVIDETYTPYIVADSSVERDVSNLSGGERTLLAFSYRLGLGQLIMQSRTGHALSMLLLDEPTESLGTEDGSIDRLAEAISKFKAMEQTIAVTHSEVFAEKAEHVVRLEKEAGVSRVTVEK